MKTNILDFIDFDKVNTLLEGFNKSTGFVTAILDLDGNVLSKSGWRQICTQFHRVHPATSKNCTTSDTVLAGELADGEKYHFYKCLNGLVDVAVPIVINGQHVANLFSGQFFFDEPDRSFFQRQAEKYRFDPDIYLKALGEVPVVSKEKVKSVMDFLLDMTQMISDITFQRLEQMELNEAIEKNEKILRLFVEHSPASIAMFDNNMRYLVASHRFWDDYNLGGQDLIGRSHYEVFPEISEQWKEFHRRGLAGETLKENNDPFPRGDGTTDWVRWEIRPWYESENQIGGIILFSEVITKQVEDQEALRESENYNRMLFEQSAIGLALTSFDGRLVDINSTFSNIIGRTVEEAKTLTYWEITPKKYQELEQQQLDSLARTGRYGPYEKEYIHKDGHLISVRLQGSLLERNGHKYIWSSIEDITKWKKAEKLLLEREETYRNIFEFSPIAAAFWDKEAKIIFWNKTAEKVFGWSKDEVIGRKFTEFFVPESARQYVEENIDLLINNISTETTLNENLRKDGSTILCEWTNTIIHDKDGNPATIISLANDITERKRAEEALRESESRFRKIYEEGPFGMALVNSSLKFIMANRKFCEIIGYTESELQKLTFRDITYPDDKDIGVESIKKLTKGEIPVFKSEKRYVRKDGTVIWGAITVTANFDKNGNFLYNVSIVEDITGRKLAEKEIKTLNERLQLLVEAIQELSIATSMENIMATVRTSARKLVNADGSTFILREGGTCFYADEDTVNPLWKGQRFPLTNSISGWAMLNKQSVIIEDIYADDRVPIEAYKSTFVRSLAIAPIRLNDPLGAIGAYWSRNYTPSEVEIKLLNTLADATAKAVENVQLIEGLEQKISERTSQLQSINKELETFTYSVSHDLKAPLRGIDGYSKLLADLYANELNDEAKHFISTIRSSTQLMSQLIDDLLQYSRLERSQLRSEPVMIKSIVNAILKVNENEIISGSFSVVTDIPDTAIIADSHGIQMALRNLIENAIKFTKKVTEPIIEIKQEESEHSWIISVKDNGLGFDMKYSQRIFEIFQRLHRVEDYPGTGIGLAMVSKAMQRMNGRTWAESTPGQGATFYLEIPKPT